MKIRGRGVPLNGLDVCVAVAGRAFGRFFCEIVFFFFLEFFDETV